MTFLLDLNMKLYRDMKVGDRSKLINTINKKTLNNPKLTSRILSEIMSGTLIEKKDSAALILLIAEELNMESRAVEYLKDGS